MNGWICSRCQRSHAPWVAACNCAPVNLPQVSETQTPAINAPVVGINPSYDRPCARCQVPRSQHALFSTRLCEGYK